MSTSSNASPQVMSFMAQRRAIGILGMALPFICFFLGRNALGIAVQPSLSAYYHTELRDIFVGILCAIGVFLFSYRGYDRRDQIASSLSALFCFGVALIPTKPPIDASQRQIEVGWVHIGCALSLFVCLAYFCLVLFRLSDSSKTMTQGKRYRNLAYAICGWLIVMSIVLAIIYKYSFADDTALTAYHPIFWLESLAIIAFGASWLIKGEAILKD